MMMMTMMMMMMMMIRVIPFMHKPLTGHLPTSSLDDHYLSLDDASENVLLLVNVLLKSPDGPLL